MINKIDQGRIALLKREYEKLRVGKDNLLQLINESELPELVYNSNAIENSTLTLKETEIILLEQSVARNVSLREVYEAKNLALVTEYLSSHSNMSISLETILLLHKMLITRIDDNIAGRLRREGEYVRVGSHIAIPPEHVEKALDDAILEYLSSHGQYFLENVSKFHLQFEDIHPFNDGNGRIGRVLINLQLAQNGYPPVIIRNRGKRDNYYPAFGQYQDDGKTYILDKLLVLSLLESLTKRIAYLKGEKVIKLSDYAKTSGQSLHSLLNAAKRQSIPAFREKNVWKIAENYLAE